MPTNNHKKGLNETKINKNDSKKTVNKNVLKIKGKSNVIISKTAKKIIKRKKYNEEKLQKAIQSRKETKISLRKIAAAFDVPVSTLARRINDSNLKKRGPATILSENEENDIVQWVLYRAERGYPVTKTELLDSVQKYIRRLQKKTPFINGRPGRHWYEAFRKRHPNLTVRKVQQLSLTRAGVSQEDIEEWFNEQEVYLKNKGLFDISADRIFNCDETSIQLCPDSEKAIVEKGSRSAYAITDATKESITVLFMYNAAGIRAPPLKYF